MMTIYSYYFLKSYCKLIIVMSAIIISLSSHSLFLKKRIITASRNSCGCFRLSKNFYRSIFQNRFSIRSLNSGFSHKDNDGIKILYDDKSIMLLWKSSNVGVLSSEIVYRAASPCVQTWLTQNNNLNSLNKNFTVNSKLDRRFSGVILFGKNNKVIEIIKKHPTEFTFSAIVIGSPVDVVHPKLAVTFLQTVKSGSNLLNKLSLVDIKTTSPYCDEDSFNNPSVLINYFSDIGIPILKDNSFVYLSLTKINNSDLIGNDIIEDKNSFFLAQEKLIPKKFIKFLKREELLYNRKQIIANNNNNDISDSRSNILFRNINFSISIDSLRPRVSSGIIIETAVKYLIKILQLKENNKQNDLQTIRVLDLGTGPGTLILSIIQEIMEYCLLNSITLPIIEATGIDINNDALSDAKENEKSLKGIDENKTVINWVQFDYSKPTRSQDVELYDNYDVIVCNPPYLSEKAGHGRVTTENKDCLISGLTGLEDYRDVCKMVSKFEQILHKNGVLIFQTPGGEKGMINVKSVVESLGFKAIDCPPDNRGIYRCLVLEKK